jgi:hypothetical protein
VRKHDCKALFSPSTGNSGAQITGFEGVDKRIDVFATAIRAGMTAYDLQELDLAYCATILLRKGSGKYDRVCNRKRFRRKRQAISLGRGWSHHATAASLCSTLVLKESMPEDI